MVQEVISEVNEEDYEVIQPKFTKKDVLKMDKNLDSLTKILEEAFKTFDESKLDNVVMAIGNTGCGKSTLMGSMILGPDKLERRKIEKKNVIDYKDNVPKVLKIGHSNQESETFYPSFYKSKGQNFYFADIAGLNDTSGEFVEIINQLMSKKLFGVA